MIRYSTVTYPVLIRKGTGQDRTYFLFGEYLSFFANPKQIAPRTDFFLTSQKTIMSNV